MTAPFSLLLAFLGLIVSAHERLNAVLLGRPVSIPWIGIIAAIVSLCLAAMVLLLIRHIVREMRPRLRTAT